MLVSANGDAPQTYTNTLSLGTSPVNEGASYRISANPGGHTPAEISVDPATGEVTFTKALYDKMTPSDPARPTGPPALITIEATYQSKKASYTFTVTDHFSPRYSHTAVAAGNDIYVIGGFLRDLRVSGSTVIPDKGSDEVWRSSDGGVTWDQAAAGPRFLPRFDHSSVVLGSDIYVIAGKRGADGSLSERSRDVWKSGNRGVTWELVTDNPGFSPRSGHRSEVLGGKIYVIAGSTDTSPNLDDVWESDNSGQAWSEATSGSTAKFDARVNHESAVLGRGVDAELYVIGGLSGINYLNDVWRSNNGASWSPVSVTTAFTPGRERHSLAVLNEGVHSGLYLIGGFASGNRIGDVWKSTDGGGSIWNRVIQNAPFGNRSDHASAVQGGALYVIGGRNTPSSYLNDVWKSTDGGQTWVNVHKNP